MRKRIHTGLAVLLSILLSMIFLAPIQAQAATAPTLKATKKTLYVGYKNYQITFKNLAKTAKVTYATSNKKVATVTSKGLVKPVAKGTATITATVKQNSKTYKLKLAVTVKNPYIRVTNKPAKLVQSSDFQLKTAVYGRADSQISYTTSNILVAKIDNAGMLHARGVGKAKITVTDKKNNLTWSFTVQVIEKNAENINDVYVSTAGFDAKYVYSAPKDTSKLSEEEIAMTVRLTDIQSRISAGLSITLGEMADYYSAKSAE